MIASKTCKQAVRQIIGVNRSDKWYAPEIQTVAADEKANL